MPYPGHFKPPGHRVLAAICTAVIAVSIHVCDEKF